MEIHCPLCGRSSKEMRFIGEFCEDCTAKKIDETIPERATIRVCKACGKIWSSGSFESESKDSVAAAIRQAFGLKRCTVKVVSLAGDYADLRLTFDVDGGSAAIRKRIAIKRQYEFCGQCSRKSAGYYEGVVQLRGDERKVSTMLAALERFLGRREAFIARVEEVRGGCDVYASDKKACTEFFSVRKMKPKMSYTLYGMKHGRKLYRNIYSVSLE